MVGSRPCTDHVLMPTPNLASVLHLLLLLLLLLILILLTLILLRLTLNSDLIILKGDMLQRF